MSKGIDVSSYNSKTDNKGNKIPIDWNQVKAAGVEFAILKVIQKSLSPDRQFEVNYANANSAGVPVVGVYNYSYATSIEKARQDAVAVISILNERKTTVWLDVEADCMKNLGHNLIDIVKAYAEVILSSGNAFGVYTGLDFYNHYFKPFSGEMNYKFWIARYPTNNNISFADSPNASYKPQIQNELWGWQYSSKGSVPGIDGNVDMSEVYVALSLGATNINTGHVQLNYKQGQGYCLNSNMIVRSDRYKKAPEVKLKDGKIKVLPKGTWVLCVGAYPSKKADEAGNIWIYIGQDWVGGKLTDQFVCADDGKNCFAG